MPLISLIIVIAVVGLFVWLITTYVPMPAPFKNIIVIVAVIAVLLMTLHAFGVFGDFSRIRL